MARDEGSQWFAVAAGIFFLAGIAIAVVAAIKVLPYLFRGAVEVTRLGVPVLGTLLGRSPLGWPAEEDATSIGTVTLLSALLWTLLGLIGGLCAWVATGPNLILLLVTTTGGMLLGAAAGAASFPQTAPETSENLDDFLNNPW